MGNNEILDEIHRIREEHARSFNYDLEAMFADWQQKEATSGKTIVSEPLKQLNQDANPYSPSYKTPSANISE